MLDKNGTPIKVITKERGDSNRLIEEFMLLANKKVAETLSPKALDKRHPKNMENDSISIYRVHDLPSKEKMTEWWPLPLTDPKQTTQTLANKKFTPDEIKKVFGNYYPS